MLNRRSPRLRGGGENPAVSNNSTNTPSGGSSGGSVTPSPSTIAGKVIDGYIEGATVCLDINLNQSCDANEPSTVTAAGGAYSLDTSKLSAAQIAGAHLFVSVPTTAKDADDGGKTLAQAGKKAFNLMAPAVSFASGTATDAVITPITTLVSHQMIVGNGRSLEASKTAVINTLGLPAGTNLMQDFIATPNATLKKQAQTIALAIGAVKDAALNDSTSPTSQVALLATLDYLQAQIIALQALIPAGVAAPTPQQVAAAITQNTNNNASSAPTSYLAGAQQTASSSVATNFATLMQTGFYFADSATEYKKIKATSSSAFSVTDYTINAAGAWAPSTAISSNNVSNQFKLGANGWADDGDDCYSGTFSGEASGAALVTCAGDSPGRISARSIDASGKKAADLGIEVSSTNDNLIFPTGSTLYLATFEKLSDRYYLFTGGTGINYFVNGTNGAPGSIVSIASLNDLLDKYSTANATAQNHYLLNAGLNMTFDAGGTSTGGTVSLWGEFQSSCTVNPCRPKIDSANYELRTVNGVQVLIVKKLHAYGDGRNMPLFSVKNGIVYSGDFKSIESSSNEKEFWFNKIMMNALLSAGSKPAVVD